MKSDFSPSPTQVDASPTVLDVPPVTTTITTPSHQLDSDLTEPRPTTQQHLSQNARPDDVVDKEDDLDISSPFANLPSYGRLGTSYASLKFPTTATPLPQRDGSPPRQSATLSPALARQALNQAAHARRMSRRSAFSRKQSVAPLEEVPVTPTMPQQHTLADLEDAAAHGVRVLSVSAVGAFKDLQTSIAAVPSDALVGSVEAAARLAKLKRKLNELQSKRKSYWLRQGGTAGAGAAGLWVTLGGSVVLSSAAALHQRNRLSQIKRAMREVIQQINQVRAVFAGEDDWQAAESAVRIDPKVFTKDINRVELWGDL